MEKKFNHILRLLLFCYVISGLILSVNTGITTDELPNQYIWHLNLEAIKNFFGFNDIGYDNLYNYEWRYKGVGFYYFSHPYIFLLKFFFNFGEFSELISGILLNHSLIFITFFLSALIAKNIVYQIIDDNSFSNIFLLLYLSYPYLMGHGFFNTTDIPFLFAWILSTYLSTNIFLKIFKNKNVYLKHILFLSLSTAFLFSIRLSGLLIFLQYLIFSIVVVKNSNTPFFNILKKFYKKIIFFTFFTFFLTFLFYPLLWNDPFIIFEAIEYLKKIPYGVCTLTLGSCMDALNLPSSYIFIWLFFKLPILTLFGFFLFPFVEKRIFDNVQNQIILGSFLLSITSIIFLLVFFKVNLYDELRHVLFLVPLLMIVSFSIVYFYSKKILLSLSFISIIFFSIQNINMYPYQYTWFNLFGNFIDINKNFEVDYWGVSGRNIAKKINADSQLNLIIDKCIYVSPKHIIEPFIDNKFKCVKPFLSIYPKSSEKYILIKYMRNMRRENPDKCKLVFNESYKLNLFSKNINLGEVYVCN